MNELENRIKELELELSNLKSEIVAGKQIENKLRESESILLESQRIANMGSFIHDLKDQTAVWTENCYVLYGYKPFEFEPTLEHYKNRVHPDDWHLVEEGFDFVLKNKVTTTAEVRIILPDGTVKWFQNNIVPIFQDDKIVKISGVNIDITERKISDIALKESEEKSRSIMENSADAIFVADQKGQYIYTNKEVSAMLGYTSEEMKRKTIADITNPNKHEEIYAIFNQVLTEGKGYTEIELLKKDGNFISTDLNAVLLPDGTVYGSCRDITERIRIEQKLKESDTKYRLIADYNYDWEFWLSNELKFNYNSPSCERVSGYKPVDFSNNPNLFTQIIHKEDLATYESHHKSSGNNKACKEMDYRIITSSGDIRWISHVCQPVFDEEGNYLGRRGTNSDITSRKNDENKISELNTELKRKNADKDRFISILSHDLRSPFNNLLGLSEILTENINKLNIDVIKTIGSHIHTTARNTYNLLEDILKWAGAQQGKIPFNPQILNFRDLCIGILKILNPNANVKYITINYSASDQINIFADTDMVKTVIRNLVSNAIKFTNTGGIIDINAEQNSEYVTVSIADNGIGIEPENLKKLFDISEVLTTKGTAGETGTGLGLLLCKEFVAKHGGKIWVESEEGKGSAFKFTLPIPADRANDIND